MATSDHPLVLDLGSVIGPQGPQGPQGQQGPQGLQGPQGEDGSETFHTESLLSENGYVPTQTEGFSAGAIAIDPFSEPSGIMRAAYFNGTSWSRIPSFFAQGISQAAVPFGENVAISGTAPLPTGGTVYRSGNLCHLYLNFQLGPTMTIGNDPVYGYRILNIPEGYRPLQHVFTAGLCNNMTKKTIDLRIVGSSVGIWDGAWNGDPLTHLLIGVSYMCDVAY